MLEEKSSKKGKEEPTELEGHFILRLPPTQAAALRAAVRSGTGNLEDRLQIKIDQDMRTSQVHFDKWVLSGKVMDLPTVAESYKTLDRKVFYKAADVSQILICHEGDESTEMEKEELPRKRERDLRDKRYLLAHGVTPPLKSVRTRRFRKTLKNKYTEVPDVEKEVKRLLHADNEAVSVRCEYVNPDDDKNDGKSSTYSEFTKGNSDVMPNEQCGSSQGIQYSIFGGDLSCSSDDSDDYESNVNDPSEDLKPEASTDTNKDVDIISCDPSDSFDDGSYCKDVNSSPNQEPPLDDFFTTTTAEEDEVILHQESEGAAENLGQMLQKEKTDEKAALEERSAELRRQLLQLQTKREGQEAEMLNIENQSLRQRFQASIEETKRAEIDIFKEYETTMLLLEDR